MLNDPAGKLTLARVCSTNETERAAPQSSDSANTSKARNPASCSDTKFSRCCLDTVSARYLSLPSRDFLMLPRKSLTLFLASFMALAN